MSFWMNHLNVHSGKANNRVLIGDYEENAIRPHVLGKFRDLVAATLHHPAMIRYLDNEQNAVNRINENCAREIIELQTLGVNVGYSQTDVQELARVLTCVGVNLGITTPNVKNELKISMYALVYGNSIRCVMTTATKCFSVKR